MVSWGSARSWCLGLECITKCNTILAQRRARVQPPRPDDRDRLAWTEGNKKAFPWEGLVRTGDPHKRITGQGADYSRLPKSDISSTSRLLKMLYTLR